MTETGERSIESNTDLDAYIKTQFPSNTIELNQTQLLNWIGLCSAIEQNRKQNFCD